jgi:hypothetical protein
LTLIFSYGKIWIIIEIEKGGYKMKKQKVLSNTTEYHLLPSNQETNALLAIAEANHIQPILKALAQTINEMDRASQDRDTRNLGAALVMGSCFNKAKALIKRPKGEFGRWCRSNCSVNDTQRRIYQRLDRNRDLIADQINTGVVLSIKGALKLIPQKLKKDKPPTNNLIRCTTLPFGYVKVSKNTKEDYYCLIFITTKRQEVAVAYKAITGSDLPPDPPAKKPAEKESLAPCIEIDEIVQETELQA